MVVSPAEDDGGGDPDPDPDPGDSDIAAPDSVRMAHVTDDTVTLRWDEVSGATGYVVSRSDAPDGDYTEIARTGERTVFYADAGVDTSVLHYYQVQTIDDAGELSAASAAGVSSLSAPEPTFPDSGVLTLDFGPGEVPGDAVQVGADTAYTVDSRVGFIETDEVTGTDRATGNALRGDFVTVGDTDLVIDVPNGDYTVDVIAGDAETDSEIAMTSSRWPRCRPAPRPPATTSR